jgi:anti-anti-sigma factor
VSLEISIRESAGVTIADLKGSATIGVDNDLLSSELRKLVAKGMRNLLLNLEELTQVDSSSIGTIAGTFVSVSRQGGTLKLLRPRGRVRLALDAMKWSDYISTFEDEAQALASFHLEAHSARSDAPEPIGR